MLVFIMFNMTPFYVEKRISQLCPKRTPCVVPMHPTLGALGHFFPDSLNCKYLQMHSRPTGIREPQM